MATKRVFKTQKKVSGGNNIYRAWEKWKEGDVLVGEYTGEGPKDKYGNPTYQFQIEELFLSNKKEEKELKGKLITLNSTGGFKKSMDSVESGDIVQITYNGQNEIKKGKWEGEMAHAIEVEVGSLGGEPEEEEFEEAEDDDGDDL